VIRLVYTSRNAISVTGVRALVHFNDIVSTARRNNERLGICGFLLFDRRRFYQVLEGPADPVKALFARIERDRRHRDIDLLLLTEIAAKRFEEWSMASFLGGGARDQTAAAHGLPAASEPPMTAERFLQFAENYLLAGDNVEGKPAKRGSDDHA
jgi:hypothetical protein